MLVVVCCCPVIPSCWRMHSLQNFENNEKKKQHTHTKAQPICYHANINIVHTHTCIHDIDYYHQNCWKLSKYPLMALNPYILLGASFSLVSSQLYVSLITNYSSLDTIFKKHFCWVCLHAYILTRYSIRYSNILS